MNGSVPDPDEFDDEVSDTNSACPDPGDDEFGDRVAVAPLTAALGAHEADFAAVASVTQGGVVQDFSPDEDIPDVAQVVAVHDFPPAAALVVHVVVVQDFPPVALVSQDVVLVQVCPPPDPFDEQVSGGLPPLLLVVPPGGVELVVPPGGVDEPPGDPGGEVVGDVELQPVWAGLVLPIP